MSDDDQEMLFSADVLRNKGVPVTLAVVAPEYPAIPQGLTVQQLIERGVEVPAAKWVRVKDEAGADTVMEKHVRFNMNVLADIEDTFGTLPAWQDDLKHRTVSCTRRTFALLFGGEARQWGEAMLDEHITFYAAALGTAWAMANGVDPQQAAAILDRAVKLAAAAAAVNQISAEELMAGLLPTTPSGSGPG